MSDEFESARPTTALGLGPAKREALNQQALEQAEPRQKPPPIETVEPVPEDFAQRVGLPDNDAPLPRDTAVLNLDVVWRSTEDQFPRVPPRGKDEDEEDDLDDSLLGPGPLPQDDLPEESDVPPAAPAEASEIHPTAGPTSHERPRPPVISEPPPVLVVPAERARVVASEPPPRDELGARPVGMDAVVPALVGIFGLIVGYILASLLLDACSG